jgi:hypothetical protein
MKLKYLNDLIDLLSKTDRSVEFNFVNRLYIVLCMYI